jgi:hypothetical protein
MAKGSTEVRIALDAGKALQAARMTGAALRANDEAMVDLRYPGRVYGRNIVVSDPELTAKLEEKLRRCRREMRSATVIHLDWMAN